jgi:hypothetical protein
MTPLSFRALAAALLALAGCATPPAEPAPPPAPPRPSAARQVIDAQLAARPSGPQTAMNGDEATVIYQNYLKQIGRPARASSGSASRGQSAGASAP